MAVANGNWLRSERKSTLWLFNTKYTGKAGCLSDCAETMDNQAKNTQAAVGDNLFGKKTSTAGERTGEGTAKDRMDE